MTMPQIPGDLAMPIDKNGISRCKGVDGINFGGEYHLVSAVAVVVVADLGPGQCWWIRNCTGAMSCKYCDVELDKGKEGSMVGCTPGPSPKRGGWL